MLYYWIHQTDRSIFTTADFFNASMLFDFCHVFIINRIFTQFNSIIKMEWVWIFEIQSQNSQENKCTSQYWKIVDWGHAMWSGDDSIQSSVVQFICHCHSCFAPAHPLLCANFYGKLSVICITGFWTLGVYSKMNNSYFSNQMAALQHWITN